MAIKMRTGKEADFDPSKMIPGEWAVSTDTRYVRMCFAHGIVLRMATYEAFEADMDQIQDILAECQNVEQAVLRIQEEIRNDWIDVEYYADLSKSYAVGGTGIRENEDVDNAEYYYEQTKRISQGMNGLIPMGTITFSDLSNPDNQQSKYMFNISDEFVTDETFKGGAGYYYGAGTNVFRTDDGFWDAFAPSSVSGVKGKNENAYRQGLVEITADNIGLGNVDNTSDADKPISDATQAALDEVNQRVDGINSNLPFTTYSEVIYTTTGDGTDKSWTATENCLLCGLIIQPSSSTSAYVKVNNATVSFIYVSGSSDARCGVGAIPVKTGQVVTMRSSSGGFITAYKLG